MQEVSLHYQSPCYTDRQLTSALGRDECVCVDAIARWLTRCPRAGLSKAGVGSQCQALNNKHDKGPAQIESTGQQTQQQRLRRTTEERREVKLKVAVRQPPRKNPWMLGYASHSNHIRFGLPTIEILI